MYFEIYNRLLLEYGHQNWWPVSGKADTFLEISIGAILTQNTNWQNVEKALNNLLSQSALDWDVLYKIHIERLQSLIKPAGFYKRKAKTIKNFVKTVYSLNKDQITRDLLLKIKGIGKETADSILLYGLEKPFFVIDAYTIRLFVRLGLVNKDIKYDKLQHVFQENLPEDVSLYKEYHALIVNHCKTYCKKRPDCINCPLESVCAKNGII